MGNQSIALKHLVKQDGLSISSLPATEGCLISFLLVPTELPHNFTWEYITIYYYIIYIKT